MYSYFKVFWLFHIDMAKNISIIEKRRRYAADK